MLGPAKPRRLDEPIAVSLADLVPPRNVYRHLEATLDLGFVRGWVSECYAERDRSSIDPVIVFKRQLVMFIEGIRSERKLIETASLNLAHRWDLGYALDEDLPDHSSLTRSRQRLGIDAIQRFFEKIVDLCQEVGLVWGRELYVDATKVEANAGIPSLVPRFFHEAKTWPGDSWRRGPRRCLPTGSPTECASPRKESGSGGATPATSRISRCESPRLRAPESPLSAISSYDLLPVPPSSRSATRRKTGCREASTTNASNDASGAASK